jgi:hypothetical protein
MKLKKMFFFESSTEAEPGVAWGTMQGEHIRRHTG